VAQVLSPHGIRGELKCRIVTDFPKQRFKRGNTVQVKGAPHVVQSARVQGTTVLLKLVDIPDRDAAETFRGADVEVPTRDALNLYIVKGQRGEILVPAIKDVIKEIDPVQGRMLVEPLPGMIPR
jgi:16S rRNA processing protein RimM